MTEETKYYLSLHYELQGRRKEATAREFISSRIMHPCALSVSWGKDSVITAFLCLPFLRQEDWLFSVSAGKYEFPGTSQVRDGFLSRFRIPAYKEYEAGDYFEAARAYGLVGITTTDSKKTRAKKTDLFDEGIRGAAMRIWGLRAEESAGRRKYAQAQGKYAFIKRDNLFALSPILGWTWEDVWSVTLHHDLPYCEIYDKHDEINGLAHGRSGTWAGTRGCEAGRLQMLKFFYPSLYNELADNFPEVTA